MSKHQILKILFAASVIVLLALHFALQISWWWLLVPVLFFVAITTYGVLNIDFNYFFKSLSLGNTSKFQIALTFDDGPVLQTKEVLRLLKEQQVPATFFCIGKNIEAHPEILQQMDAENHLVGNHSYSHAKTFDLLPAQKMLEEIEQTQTLIEKTIGKKTRLFRPPYGITNPPLAKAFAQTNLISVGWSARAFDTTEKDETKIFNSLCKQLKPGAIVLLHDRIPHTLNVTGNLINYCKDKGIEIIALDKLLALNVYE